MVKEMNCNMYKPKICPLCNSTFTPTTSARQRYCNKPIVRICANCGKEYTSKCNPYVGNTCSNECKNKLAAKKRIMSYEKQTKHCVLCGKAFHPRSNTQVLCGDTHYRKCKQCGKEFLLRTDKIDSVKELPVVCSEECRRKYIFRNGNPMQKPGATRKLSYGRYSGTIEQRKEYDKFFDNPELYLKQLPEKLTLFQLCDKLGIHSTTMGHYINKYRLQKYIIYNMSGIENEVVDFIRSFYNGNIVRHDRNSIKPYELDIYIPEFNFAIECDPTSVHNSTVGIISDTPKHWKYHQMKNDLCDSHGITLFHIFGYDWTNKREIIQSMIKSKISTSNKIYARNCVIKEVTNEDCCNFLDKNHRQGKAISKVRLGLYNDDELVSVMTLSHIRNTIGTGKEDLSDCWELVRFCSKLHTTVIGGASKLFKYFVNNYHPNRIRSFSDRAHTSGKVYLILGFKEIRRSDPGYMWVNLNTDQAINRVACQKQNIDKLFPEETIDKTLTEKDIMISHGFVQVFDSGTVLWEWGL